MSPGDDRGRPGEEAAQSNTNTTTKPFYADPAAMCEAYAVVVTIAAEEATKTVRRLYLSLHSAEKAVRRAEIRGSRAALVLCRLTPVQADLVGAGWSE